MTINIYLNTTADWKVDTQTDGCIMDRDVEDCGRCTRRKTSSSLALICSLHPPCKVSSNRDFSRHWNSRNPSKYSSTLGRASAWYLEQAPPSLGHDFQEETNQTDSKEWEFYILILTDFEGPRSDTQILEQHQMISIK